MILQTANKSMFEKILILIFRLKTWYAQKRKQISKFKKTFKN